MSVTRLLPSSLRGAGSTRGRARRIVSPVALLLSFSVALGCGETRGIGIDPGTGEGGGGAAPGGCAAAGPLSIEALGADAPAGFEVAFDREVAVWGLRVYATPTTDAAKVEHAAHVMAQYLDNDEDCAVDDAAAHSDLLDARATLVMFATEREAETTIDILEDTVSFAVIEEMALQDLYGSETHPGGASRGVFDASLEEVLHLVSSAGWSVAHPDTFGTEPGSAVADAMDIARGGFFETVPDRYPPEAWYRYNDPTCDYDCMTVEYLYWALTSHLGGQAFPGRCEQIEWEWTPCTPEAFAVTDAAMHEILTDPSLWLPSVLPDGSYEPAM